MSSLITENVRSKGNEYGFNAQSCDKIVINLLTSKLLSTFGSRHCVQDLVTANLLKTGATIMRKPTPNWQASGDVHTHTHIISNLNTFFEL